MFLTYESYNSRLTSEVFCSDTLQTSCIFIVYRWPTESVLVAGHGNKKVQQTIVFTTVRRAEYQCRISREPECDGYHTGLGFSLFSYGMFFVGMNNFLGIFPLKVRNLLASKCSEWAACRLKLIQNELLEVQLGLRCSVCLQRSWRGHCQMLCISPPHSSVVLVLLQVFRAEIQFLKITRKKKVPRWELSHYIRSRHVLGWR